MIASSFKLKGVWNPLARGGGLVILPARILVRWSGSAAAPKEGEPIECPKDAKAVVITKDKIDALQTLLFSAVPLDRCESAIRLPEATLVEIYSYTQAKSLITIARRLDPRIRAHIRSGVHASLHRLIYICGVESGDAQINRWNENYREEEARPSCVNS